MSGLRPSARLGLALALVSSVLGPSLSFAQSGERWRRMNQPFEPFRIVGNIHWVGASDVASYLVTTPEGHVLIDGGFAETVPIIESGIEKLGFRLEDVRILLHSHAHFDHVGGLARWKERYLRALEEERSAAADTPPVAAP